MGEIKKKREGEDTKKHIEVVGKEEDEDMKEKIKYKEGRRRGGWAVLCCYVSSRLNYSTNI